MNCRKAIKRVDPKSSYHQEKIVFFSSYCISPEIMDVKENHWDNHSTIYVNQAIMLFALTVRYIDYFSRNSAKFQILKQRTNYL